MDVNDHLTLSFDLHSFFFKSNRCYNFWTTRDRAFLFHMYIRCDEAFLIVPKFFILWSLPWPLTYISKDFYIGHNFCTVRDIDFIFAIHTKVIKPFSLTPRSTALWPWLWPLTYISKSFNLYHNFLIILFRVFVFDMHIPFDEAFPFMPKVMTLLVT